LGTPIEEKQYAYKQTGWKDQLVSYGTESCVYDVLGNPTTYRDRNLVWQGRRLLSYGKDNKSASFTYDASGIRTSKVISQNGEAVSSSKYIYDGNNLVAEQSNGNWLYYLYGADGISSFNYNDTTYLYRKNVQGDVTHIYKQNKDAPLELVAQYAYDAWGNCRVLVDVGGIAEVNPFRYRSYYFDEETGLYYLQTRYYDPEVGRFINADSIEYLDPETIDGLNLYAYCGNNPVMRIDTQGSDWNSFWEKVNRFLKGAFIALGGAFLTLISLPIAAVIPGAGFITQFGFSLMMYGGFMMGSVFDSQIEKDMENIGWNAFNTNESLVIKAEKVSFYKGVPIVKIGESGRSGSFLGIWLRGSYDENTIRHEWGHTIQQGIMGWAKYLTMIGLPSAFYWGSHKWDPRVDYYITPWDCGADYFGGIKPRTHEFTTRTREDEVRAIWYLVVSTLFWPAGYFFLI